MSTEACLNDICCCIGGVDVLAAFLLLLGFVCRWWTYNHIFFRINLLAQRVFVESPLGTRQGSRSCGHSAQVQGGQVLRELTFWERGRNCKQ